MSEPEIQVLVDPNSFELTESGNLVGIIYFQTTQYDFPEKGWYDFVVTILAWWLEALADIVEGKSETKDLRFMDGPVYAHIQKKGGDISIQFITAKSDSKIITNESLVSLPALVSAVWETAQDVIDECEKRSWKLGELDALRQQLLRFRVEK